ncbi:MAG: hypothetical protein ACKO96_36425, partial [Flammeovirgaceae bacterium]
VMVDNAHGIGVPEFDITVSAIAGHTRGQSPRGSSWSFTRGCLVLKMSNQNGFTVLRHEQKSVLLEKLKRRRANGYFRSGSFSDEIIWQDRKFLFPSPKKKVLAGMWVFRSVMLDVRLYIENR